MNAYYTVGDVVYPLIEISAPDMQEIFDDSQKSDIVGVPQYFDCHERLWPHPDTESYTVKFSD